MIRLLILVVLVAPLCSASAASFICNDSSTAIEVVICGDETLSHADIELVRLVERAKATNPSAIADQDAWISNIRNACGDAECLANAYLARIADLEMQLNDVREVPPSLSANVESAVIQPEMITESTLPPLAPSPVTNPDPAVSASENPKSDGGGGIWGLVGLGFLIYLIFKSSSKPSSCDMCGTSIKRKYYTRTIADKRKTLCPKCNSRVENRRSKEAFKAAFDD